MFISTAELSSIIDDPNALIIDARSFSEYSQGHLPGAIHLDLFAFHWIDTSPDGIKEFNRQATILLSFAGVTFDKKIIFYDAVSGMLAARGLWMLMYFSHENTAMLDGGFTKWEKEDRPIQLETNKFKPSKFAGRAKPELVAGFQYIKDNAPNLKIIDARSAKEFDGEIIRAAKTGHIPNAVNIDWNLNLASDGTMKNISELSKLYGEIPKDTQIVTYCQGAYRAANSFVALKKLGFENVKVYLGSWGEWGNKLDL